MAFENVFQGIDFQAPVRADAARQAQFLTILGDAFSKAQQQAQFDERMKLEKAKAQQKPFDLEQLAQQNAYNLLIAKGIPPETAAIEAYQGFQRPIQTMAGEVIMPSNIMANLGLGSVIPQSAPMDMQQGMPQAMPSDMPQESPMPIIPPSTVEENLSVVLPSPVTDELPATLPQPTGPQFPMPEATPLPPELQRGSLGAKMQFEERKDLNKARFQKELEFAQKKYESGKAVPVIAKSIDRLEEINDKLLAKQAILSGDAGIVDNLKAKWGGSWVGRETQSVTKPEIESLRQEYDRVRDGLIPYYITANDLPATVVDTEEFQQRILKAFGDPSLIHEANSAALNNMRMQFGVKSDKTPSIKEGTVIENDKGERLILKGGQWQKM